MEKTLHDYFYINTGKEIKLYSSRESSTLIEAANIHIERIRGNDSPNTIPALEAYIYDCMDEFHRNGVTDHLLNKLNDILKNVKIQCLIENIENSITAVHVAFIPYNSSPSILGAYMFSHVRLLGGFEGLKRCHNSTCCKFFIGRPNAKWCSKSCGSKHRVTKMRKSKLASCSNHFI